MSEPIGAESPRLVEVQDNLDEDVDLKSLAAAFGYSPFHFHRAFKREIGETPKGHVDRLRLEKAWLRVAVSDDSILNIALAVGFKSHETFSRAFKRAYGVTPTAFRRAAQTAQAERLERNRSFRGDGCTLSEVRFVTLPAMPLLAIRRVGPYATSNLAPWAEDDPYWRRLAAWAEAEGAGYAPLAIGVYYDIPGVTPDEAMRSDYCIPLDADVDPEEPLRCIRFAGGVYATAEHLGSAKTLIQGYRHVADGIRRAADRYSFADGPPIEIFHEVRIGGDKDLHRTEVGFPVTRVR